VSKPRFGGGRWRLVGATAVLVCAICAFIVSAAAQADQPTVCGSGCAYTSIQDAINAASPGATITVGPGTYVESGHVYDRTISNLTIQGTGDGNDPSHDTIINASGACSGSCLSNTYGLLVRDQSNITLKNFRLIGPGPSSVTLVTTGYGMKLDNDTNVIVDHVTVVNSQRSNVDMNGTRGATLTNITATGAGNGNGITFSDSSNITVNGITTSGNAWGGIALYAKGAYFPCGVDAISISNASLGEVSAIYTGIDVNSSCTISNVTVPAATLPYKVVLNGPEGGMGDPQDVWVKSLADATTVGAQTSSTTPLLYSSSDGSSWATSGFSIQNAVDTAQPGATVHVGPGTYPEDVTVAKALTLDGAQSGVDARTRSGSESTVKSISVSASNVAVDGFTFNGTGSQVSVSSTGSILSGVAVRNNVFSGYHSVGLPTFNAGNIAISQNLFKNATSSSEAMQIKASTTAGGCNGTTVQNNTFTAATNNGGADVNFYCTGSDSSNVTVSGNSSTGLSGGSSFTAFSGVDTGISVTNNVATSDGSSVFFFGNVSGTASITGNTLRSTSGSSVSIHGGDAGTSDTPNSGAFTISNNTLSGAASGVAIAASTLTGSATIHGNDLSGSATGVTNHSAVTVNATGNWWGSSAGPGAVSGVTTSSWCLDSTCAHLHDETPAAPPATTTTTTTTPAPVAPAAPTPNAPQSAPATPSQSGSVTVAVAPVVSTPSGGGGTTAPAAPVTIATSWSPTTFTTPVTVTVTPQPLQVSATGGTGSGGSTTPTPPPVAGGFSVGNTVVQVTITDDATGQPVTQFAAPLVIHISGLPAGQVPAYSHDGTSWTTIPQLSSPDLPASQSDGYFLNPDGSIDIYTHHATLYGLLLDTQAPTAPKPKVIVQSSGVRLSWAGAKDNLKVDHYVITRNGHGYKSTKRTVFVLPLKAGTYVIRALDAAGNKSAPSLKVTIVRTGDAKHPFAVHIVS
jgi:hypothetical protein